MRINLIAIFLISFLTSFTNGVWTAKLFCKSESGRTIFEAELEDMQILISAKLTIDDEEISFDYMDNNNVIFDPSNNVFTLNINSESKGNFDSSRFVEFWAVPSSFSTVKSKDGAAYSYEFKANIRARDPRKNEEFSSPVILLNCSLNYFRP